MSQYLNDVVRHYEFLLNFSYRVINSLKGKKEADSRKFYIEYLATKIFLHAASVRHLRHGSEVILASNPEGAHIIDFPSAIVITRAILETYLNLFETFFEPTSDDEFEYRSAVYAIKGFKALEISVQRNPNPVAASPADLLKTQATFKNLQDIREVIKKTKTYQGLDNNQKKATLEGKLYPDRVFAKRAAAAGFGESFIDNMYMYMSSFTHGDSLSAVQTVGVETDSQKDIYFQVYMSYIMMILSLLIRDYAKTFPEAKTVCDSSPREMGVVNQLLREVANT